MQHLIYVNVGDTYSSILQRTRKFLTMHYMFNHLAQVYFLAVSSNFDVSTCGSTSLATWGVNDLSAGAVPGGWTYERVGWVSFVSN